MVPTEFKTPLDTDEIVAARQTASQFASTAGIDSPDRKRLRERIVEELCLLSQIDDERDISLGHGGGRPKSGVNQKRQAYLVIGPPASGKSMLAKHLSEKTHSLIIDSDMAKAKLPEFEGGRGAGAVHIESAEIILPEVLAWAVINGDNVVLPVIGRSLDDIHERIYLLEENGYSVHLILNHLDRYQATERAIERWKRTGRFVDPDYVYNDVADKPLENYNRLRMEGGLASYAQYLADQPQGCPPRLIDRTRQSPEIWPD